LFRWFFQRRENFIVCSRLSFVRVPHIVKFFEQRSREYILFLAIFLHTFYHDHVSAMIMRASNCEQGVF